MAFDALLNEIERSQLVLNTPNGIEQELVERINAFRSETTHAVRLVIEQRHPYIGI